MIRKCENPKCGKEIEANGKRRFCDATCRKAYNYLKKAGKLTEAKQVVIKPDQEPERRLMGKVVKTGTTPTGKYRVQIDFELLESDGLNIYWNKPAEVLFYNEKEGNDGEEKDPYLD